MFVTLDDAFVVAFALCLRLLLRLYCVCCCFCFMLRVLVATVAVFMLLLMFCCVCDVCFSVGCVVVLVFEVRLRSFHVLCCYCVVLCWLFGWCGCLNMSFVFVFDVVVGMCLWLSVCVGKSEVNFGLCFFFHESLTNSVTNSLTNHCAYASRK